MSRLIGSHSVIYKSTAGGYLRNGPQSPTTLGYMRPDLALEQLLEYSDKRTANPAGYGGDANVIPLQAGDMSAKYLEATGALAADITRGIPLTAALSANGTLVATLALIVNLQAALVASGNITTAQLSLTVNLIASLSGSGNVTTADLTNVVNLLASISGSGNITTADVTTLINLSASIGNGTAENLTYEGIAVAVLDALLADHNDAGSVGEALNNVGAGGNPWASALSSNTTPGTFGERVQKLLTTAKFLGLK